MAPKPVTNLLHFQFSILIEKDVYCFKNYQRQDDYIYNAVPRRTGKIQTHRYYTDTAPLHKLVSIRSYHQYFYITNVQQVKF